MRKKKKIIRRLHNIGLASRLQGSFSNQFGNGDGDEESKNNRFIKYLHMEMHHVYHRSAKNTLKVKFSGFLENMNVANKLLCYWFGFISAGCSSCHSHFLPQKYSN